MGLIRAGIGAAKAAAKGGSASDIGVAAVKGVLPRKMGKLVDKVATPENIGRVTEGVRSVVDSTRSSTFTNHSTESDPWGDTSTPSTPKAKAPEVDPWA